MVPRMTIAHTKCYKCGKAIKSAYLKEYGRSQDGLLIKDIVSAKSIKSGNIYCHIDGDRNCDMTISSYKSNILDALGIDFVREINKI